MRNRNLAAGVMRSKDRRLIRTWLVVWMLCWAVLPIYSQSGAPNGEWRTYGGDLGSTRYAPLDQINAGNFSKLEVAWRFKTDNFGPRPEFKVEATPLMIHGVLYLTAGTRRSVVAVNAATGELLWMHSEDEGARGAAAPRKLDGHGVAYWTDGKEERIVYITPGYRMIALDAKTGVRVATFGNDGVVDLKQDDDQQIELGHRRGGAPFYAPHRQRCRDCWSRALAEHQTQEFSERKRLRARI